MAVSAAGGVSSVNQQQQGKPQPAAPMQEASFSQHLDAQTGVTHGHHHHHGGAAQSMTTSAAGAASTAGSAPASSVVSALMNLRV